MYVSIQCHFNIICQRPLLPQVRLHLQQPLCPTLPHNRLCLQHICPTLPRNHFCQQPPCHTLPHNRLRLQQPICPIMPHSRSYQHQIRHYRRLQSIIYNNAKKNESIATINIFAPCTHLLHLSPECRVGWCFANSIPPARNPVGLRHDDLKKNNGWVVPKSTVYLTITLLFASP